MRSSGQQQRVSTRRIFRAVPRRLSYANVAATLALFFAMSGGALAAKHYLISSTKQLSPKVLKALKGQDGGHGATGPQGSKGEPGALGARGDTGPKGERGEAGRRVRPAPQAQRGRQPVRCGRR
jgi:hypothetical protein